MPDSIGDEVRFVGMTSSSDREKPSVAPQTPSVDGSMEVLREDLQVQLLEQEHRLVSVVRNLLQYRSGPEPFRKASLVSAGYLLSRILLGGTVAGSFGVIAVLGLLAAIRANDLLAQQNRRLDQQTLLIDAQRRASLNIEISSIWDQIRQEAPIGLRSKVFQPSETLTARVVALTRALSPYFTLSSSEELEPRNPEHIGILAYLGLLQTEPDLQMEMTALSPERGQLLVALTSLGVDVSHMSRRGATFAYADLREQLLSFPVTDFYDLTGADFSGSVLWRTDFTESLLTEANFTCAYFEHVVFGFNGSPFFADNANFRYVDFSSYVVGPADPEGPAPTSYYMAPAIFSYIDVSDSFLEGLTFYGYESIDEISLPDSFDRERYSLDESEGKFVVRAISPSKETERRQVANDYCAQYKIVDSRLARVMWGDVLSGEWQHETRNDLPQ